MLAARTTSLSLTAETSFSAVSQTAMVRVANFSTRGFDRQDSWKIKDRKHLQIRIGYQYALHRAVYDETDMTYDMGPVCTCLRYFWMIYSDAALP